MKRIGKTDQGGIILEMTTVDVIRLMDACKAMSLLFDEVDVCIPGQADPVTELDTPPLATKAVRKVRIPAESTAKAGASANCDGEIPCSKCQKLFKPARADSRFCSKACRDADYRAQKGKQVRKPAKEKSVPVDGSLPLYKIVAGVLAKSGPMTTPDMVMALGKDGVKTDTKKLGVMLSTYKKLFKRVDGHKWTFVENPGRQVQKAPQVPPAAPATGKAERLALIKRLANKGVSAPQFVERGGVSPNLEDIPEYQRARQMAGEEG